MADPHVLTTLTAKREEIETYIRRIEKQLLAARHDLAHVNATIRLFEVNGAATEFPVYIQLKKMFSKGELPKLCRDAIEASRDGEADTRQLATYVLAAKGWDRTDRVLAVSVAQRITHVLTAAERTGKFKRCGKRNGANVWRVACAAWELENSCWITK